MLGIAQREWRWFLLQVVVFIQDGASLRPLKVTRIDLIVDDTIAQLGVWVGGTIVRQSGAFGGSPSDQRRQCH